MRACLLVTACLGSAVAADLVDTQYADLRLSGGYVGHRVQINPDDGKGVENIDYRETDRVTLDWLFSMGTKTSGGWIWGFGASYGNARGTFRDQDIVWRSWGLRLLAGYVVPIGERVRIELLPYMGVGRNYLDTGTSATLPTLHTNDYYRELGINLTALYVFPNGFLAGVTTGILRQDGEDDDHGNYTFRATNAVALAVVGVRF